MTYHELDQIFPYFVFVYGFVMTAILNTDLFVRLAEEKLPNAMYMNFTSHRLMGIVCLVVGALWSLQNLWVN